jgi:IS4 transposase
LEVVAQDGTLLRALPRMVWALWQDEEHRGIKIHLEFDVLRSVPKAAPVTDGNTSEIRVLRENLSGGKVYLVDAGYVQYELYEDIRQAQSSFVARLHDNAAYDILQERELSEDDVAAGVTFDRVVRLGSKATRGDLSEPVRLVQVHVKSPPQLGLARRRSKVSSKKTFRHRPKEYDLLLATDLMHVPAEVIATLFRYRWTIELFFRWFKCVLGFSHLICESREGVQIMVYCALIVSLLITLWTGRKPTRRTLEMIQLYFQGWAELDELEAHIEGLKTVTD